jgi:5-methylcytosine-specific restriction protein B
VELLRRKKNVVLQGPPGTGKTWLAKRLGYALMGVRDDSRLTAVQFQPTLSYEDFVRGWRPDGSGGLKLADGVFLDAVFAALEDPTRPYVLVVEEINRGNPAQILGEMLTLLEDGKRSREEALRLAYPRTVDERIYVPENLYLIGTMNLADRSLALVDLALRRRFAFLSLTPLFNQRWRRWLLDRGAPAAFVNSIAERMTDLNKAIAEERSLGSQFQVGHSFLTPIASPGGEEAAWRKWYLETVRTEIAPLLLEYWYDDVDAAKAQIGKLKLTTE